jgi:hypothetical protein
MITQLATSREQHFSGLHGVVTQFSSIEDGSEPDITKMAGTSLPVILVEVAFLCAAIVNTSSMLQLLRAARGQKRHIVFPRSAEIHVCLCLDSALSQDKVPTRCCPSPGSSVRG